MANLFGGDCEMKTHECEQGSDIWLSEKLGVITGTRALQLMSSNITRRTLLAEIISELLTSERKSDKKSFSGTPAMKRGLNIEDEAASYYGIMHDCIVTDRMAYIESDISPLFAASPDGLIGSDGGYEGKRLDKENHIKLLLGQAPEKKYIKQCEWNIFITGRKWWILNYYCEELPVSMRSYSITIPRNEQMMKDMKERALDMLGDLTSFLNQHGLGGLLS